MSLTSDQEKAILDAFDAHFAASTRVAVRASTVGHRLEESEDSASNPFAGMSETFLYVLRDQVTEKVRLCWGSGFSEESLIYRHAQGMDLLGFSVSVAIQEMVFGERSFVLFTCDPKTASRDTVIVAGWGIGEGVVQDKVACDHYFINNTTRDIRREIVDKTDKLTFDKERGYGLIAAPVEEALRGLPCLTDQELRSLVDYGQTIEKIFACPQDIEGTITDSGAITFLQARPIAFDYRRMRVWTNANVTESFPGVTTALTYSFSRYFYRVIFFDCYRKLGLSMQGLHDNHESLDHMIGFLGGRVYYCLTSFYHLHSQSPLFPVFRGHWEKMMGFRTSYETQPRNLLERTLQYVTKGSETGAAALVILFRYATHDRAMASFFRWWEGLFGPLRGKSFPGLDPMVLLGEFHRVWTEVGNQWGVTLLNDTYLPVIYGFTEQLFTRWGLSVDTSLLSDLLCGDEELLSVEIIHSAVRLAERVRKDESLRRAFETKTPEQLWEAVERAELEAAFVQAAREHCHRYGDRGLQELKMEQPNLRHNPAVLMKMVQSYVSKSISVDDMKDKERAVRLEGEKRLASALSGHPERKLVMGYLLRALRQLVRWRENSRYCRSELFGFSKNIFRALGDHFASSGVLRRADDIYHLTQDEVFGYVDGTGVTENLQALADLRRSEFEQNQAVETPMELTTLGPVRANQLASRPRTEVSSGELRGLGSSTGKVRGRARVVLDPNCAEELGKDTILIARETDPGWLFLMLASKGIVVERGSMLSHTAITGRKFGIPTIVSLAGATTRIPDGAWIEMDGASGVVTVLPDGG
jgi:pyruvate,water dikinase